MSNKNTPGGRVRVCRCPKPCPEHERQKSFAARSATRNATLPSEQLQTVSDETLQPIQQEPLTRIDADAIKNEANWQTKWRRPPSSSI